MAPSPAFPWPRSSISSSFIFSLHSSFHLLCAAVSLPPAASPVPPASLSALGSFVRVAAPWGRQHRGCIVPACSPRGFSYSLVIATIASRHQGTGSAPRRRQSRQEAAGREGAPAGRVPAQTHTPAPQDPPASRDKQGPGSRGSSLHLHRETYGKAKEHNILFFITKHPSCLSVLLAAPLSAVRVGLKCSFHLHLVECPRIVKISVLCVLGPLVPTERGTVLLAPHHTMQINTIYISRGFFTVSCSSNLIHCFLCCLGNRNSIPRILYQGLGITVPKCTKL